MGFNSVGKVSRVWRKKQKGKTWGFGGFTMAVSSILEYYLVFGVIFKELFDEWKPHIYIKKFALNGNHTTRPCSNIIDHP